MSVKNRADVIQLFRVLRQYVFVPFIDGLVNTLSALDVLEVLHEFKSTLSGSQFLERVLYEGLGHVFNFLNLLPESLHDSVPAVLVLPVEYIKGHLRSATPGCKSTTTHINGQVDGLCTFLSVHVRKQNLDQ